MRTTQQFSITLPLDMAEVVEEKIKTGFYASVSEVMRDGVRALLEALPQRWRKGGPKRSSAGRTGAIWPTQRKAWRRRVFFTTGSRHGA